jgi:WD40 repeat protein
VSKYVKLAVSILKEPTEKVDSALRDWAVDLLDQSSSTRFSKLVAERLKAGQATLPSQLAALLAGGAGGVALSPDGYSVATGHDDGNVHVWHAESSRHIAQFRGHEGPVTALAYSPDAVRILSGSLDGTAHLWDIKTGQAMIVLGGIQMA